MYSWMPLSHFYLIETCYNILVLTQTQDNVSKLWSAYRLQHLFVWRNVTASIYRIAFSVGFFYQGDMHHPWFLFLHSLFLLSISVFFFVLDWTVLALFVKSFYTLITFLPQGCFVFCCGSILSLSCRVTVVSISIIFV